MPWLQKLENIRGVPWSDFEGAKMSLKETEAQDLAVSLEWLQKELCGLIYKYPPVVMKTTVHPVSFMDIDSKMFDKFPGNTEKARIKHAIHRDLIMLYLKYRDSES